MEIEIICGQLQEIAETHPKDSKEYHAVELAAKGLLFIYMNNHKHSFLAFIEEMDEELTDAQRTFLKQMGL